MTALDPRDDTWLEDLRRHRHEIARLRVEIALLESDPAESAVVRGYIRTQIELANAWITRHQISAELIESRLRALG